ncbi:complex I 51 kDa subunit family protein [Paramaledivibacter caminithermalis]|jgi:NADH-quinone oxidoreductase subunit F|uniref:NADH-quinone oxidoreductase subunit F n=1 Tax=Paramaledivibacter caminithermalis (strain DSM 15212 / CIP 107654 / DViRD3) TaxID=1121301 RepID=A0A1M6PUC6_PARC5|nr:NADH-ubiquinone oxidoreductase-F iron-sulfur binding region domain-containing protein [Paramaledivibacter caminithermalis]SHK11535.1 NADH-quinone oxidoreductase subunit F [Paramaledivibacter caminithermalis DSM 15212]
MVSFVSSLCGKISPLSLKEYKDNGGFDGLQKAIFHMKPHEVVKVIEDSNLKGRGGAAFPTGLKWKFISMENSDEKYIICNADEGEPGTFKDKILLDGCPLQIIEGMIIAAYATKANKGYIYIRGEYPKTREILLKAVEILRDEGYLGDNILGQEFSFDIDIRSGAGAYVCGEETALIESIEGNPGRSRFKPPYPPSEGLWRKPTLVNNVETLANVPLILSFGADEFKKYGTEGSRGTKLISVSGNVVNRGVFEIELGTTLKEIIYDICGGTLKDKKLKFIQLGGSSGACIPQSLLDIRLDFDELRKYSIGLGSGAILVVDESTCIIDFIKNTMEFFKHESCGKCTPCREGNRHIIKILDRIQGGEGSERDIELLKNISLLMKEASLCGLGQAAPTAIFTTLKYFGDEYKEHLKGYCRCGICDMKGREECK